MEGNVIDTSKAIMGGKQIHDSPEFGARIRETYDKAKGPGKGQEMVDALKSEGAQKTKSIMEDNLGMKLYGDETFEEILEIREQAEGRNHRIGTEDKVTYIDLVSEGTVDEKIIYSLRNKINLATSVLAEDIRKWLI